MFHFSSDAGLGGSCLCGKQLTRFWNKATDTLSLSLSLSLSQVLRRWLALLLVPVSTEPSRNERMVLSSSRSLICQSSLTLSFFIVSVLHPSLCLFHFSWAARPVAFIIVKSQNLAAIQPNIREQGEERWREIQRKEHRETQGRWSDSLKVQREYEKLDIYSEDTPTSLRALNTHTHTHTISANI